LLLWAVVQSLVSFLSWRKATKATDFCLWVVNIIIFATFFVDLKRHNATRNQKKVASNACREAGDSVVHMNQAMNRYPWLTTSPEKDETLVAYSLRNNSPSHQSHHYDSYWVDANEDESPQGLLLKKRPALVDRNQSTHHRKGHGKSTRSVNTTNVPDTANTEECFTNTSESEAPDYSSALCMQAFDFERNEPRHRKRNTRLTNGTAQAKNSTAFGLYQETDQSHVLVRRELVASPKVRARHPAMFSKRTALVDRLIDEWERLPMFFQSNEGKSSRTLTEPTMTDGYRHVMQTFTPPTEDVRGDGMLGSSSLFESASTNDDEEEETNETGNVHPSKIRKVSDTRQVLARRTTTSNNPVSPDAEPTMTDGCSHVMQTLTPPAKDAHGDDTLGPCLFESDDEEQTNESSSASTNKIRNDLKKPQVARGRTGDNPVSTDEDFQRAWMLVGHEEPDRSVDTINNKTGTEQVPVAEHKQPPHNGRSLPPPNSQQKHSQTERSQYPTTMHQRERQSLKAPAHLAANQLLCQKHGSYSAPWSLLQNTKMVALTKPPPESPRHPPQRKKQSLLYKKRPYEPKYPIVDIAADGWDGMVTRLKNFKGWHGVSRSSSSSVALLSMRLAVMSF
jgi:hypothetical protein